MTHDDTEPLKRGPGRPPKMPKDRRRNGVTVRFTDDELDRLEALAADAGEAVATFVWRSALRDGGAS